jgi:hypothetical protein
MLRSEYLGQTRFNAYHGVADMPFDSGVANTLLKVTSRHTYGQCGVSSHQRQTYGSQSPRSSKRLALTHDLRVVALPAGPLGTVSQPSYQLGIAMRLATAGLRELVNWPQT